MHVPLNPKNKIIKIIILYVKIDIEIIYKEYLIFIVLQNISLKRISQRSKMIYGSQAFFISQYLVIKVKQKIHNV